MPASVVISAKSDRKMITHMSFSFEDGIPDDTPLLSPQKQDSGKPAWVDLPDDAFRFVALALQNAIKPNPDYV